MQQELMRAVVLIIASMPDSKVDDELRALETILRRASRAMEGRVLEELVATASGQPQPEDT